MGALAEFGSRFSNWGKFCLGGFQSLSCFIGGGAERV